MFVPCFIALIDATATALGLRTQETFSLTMTAGYQLFFRRRHSKSGERIDGQVHGADHKGERPRFPWSSTPEAEDTDRLRQRISVMERIPNITIDMIDKDPTAKQAL